MSGDHNMYASGNQPAFPRPGDFNPQIGMTLRDYFAAKAMHGIIASFPTSLPPSVTASEAAYQYADAMLKARGH